MVFRNMPTVPISGLTAQRQSALPDFALCGIFHESVRCRQQVGLRSRSVQVAVVCDPVAIILSSLVLVN